MKSKYKNAALLFALLVISMFIFSTLVLAEKNSENKEKKKRVIAHTEKEVDDAITKGCKKVREARTLKALECSEGVALQLGLQEDIRVFALDEDENDFKEKRHRDRNDRVSVQDVNANKQIRADLVHVSGNTGSGRKVVVLDTGYNYNHPELSSSYLGGKDFVNDDNDPSDDNGHGSHVSGIVTNDGVNASAKGVAPDAGVIAGKVLDASGSGFFSDVVAAIYWAVDGNDGIAGPVCTTDNSTNTTTCTNDDFNADAVSMSLGTAPPYTFKGFCDNILPDLTNAIKYARSRSVTVVSAAGNSGSAGVSIPGCISYSVTVGAVDSRDKIASFSGRGGAVDLTAPGVNIFSAWLGNSYKTASGTSMSTPMVSSTVALVKYAHPSYSVTQVENALFKTAKDLGKTGKDTSYGYGRVDAYGAVNFVG